MKKILLILFLLSGVINAQRFIMPPAVQKIDTTNSQIDTTFTQGTTVQIILEIRGTQGSGIIDPVVLSSNISFPTNQIIADSNRAYTSGIGDWTYSSGDSMYNNSDSTYKLIANTGFSSEFALPLDTLDQQNYYEVFVTHSEGEENIISNSTFDENVTGWVGTDADIGQTTLDGHVCVGLEATNTVTVYLKNPITGLNVGDWIYVTYDYYIPSTNTTADQVGFGVDAVPSVIGSTMGDSLDQWQTISEYLQLTDDQNLYFWMFPVTVSVGDSIYFDNIRVYVLDDSTQSVESGKLIYSFDGSILDSSSTVTASEQTDVVGFWGTGDSSSFSISLNDTDKVDFAIQGLQKQGKYHLSYLDTLQLPIVADISTVGTFNETVQPYGNYSGSPTTIDVDYQVYASNNLYVNGVDTNYTRVDFGTVSTTTKLDTVLFTNNSLNTMRFAFWFDSLGQDFWTNSNFKLAEGQSTFGTLVAGESKSLIVRFNPTVDGYYYQKLIVFSSTDNITDERIVDTIAFAGTASGLNELVVGSPDLSVTNSIENITLDWTVSNNATNYYIYRKASDEASYILLSSTENEVYVDLTPISYLNYDYYVLASNGNISASSDTVTTSMTYSGNVFFVSSDGSPSNSGEDSSDAVKTIANQHDISVTGATVLFKSGDQFDDAVLIAKQGITYATYGGTEKAIIGDSVSNPSLFTKTIDIDQTGVELRNLKIFNFYNAEYTITFSEGDLIIDNCIIAGSNNVHSVHGSAIEATTYTTDTISITNNIIYDFYRAIQLRRPKSIEIAYNTMYNFYRYDGYANHGGWAISASNSGLTTAFDCEYTFHIHHNNIYNYEHTAMFVGSVSNVLVEYNYIHDNLDERLYMGGVKHGNPGKFWDNTGLTTGPVGNIFRYNVVANIKEYGSPDSAYTQGTPAEIDAGTINAVAQTGYLHPTYIASGGTYSSEKDYVTSGLGYSNSYIHNNIYYRTRSNIYARGYSEYAGVDLEYNTELGSYFVNNTIYEPYPYYAFGSIYTKDDSQSPTYVFNNILSNNVNSSLGTQIIHYGEIFFAESYCEADNNIHVYRDESEADSIKSGRNSTIGSNQYYETDPNWIDTTANLYVFSVGANAMTDVYIPDLRITEGGNAYSNGKSYANINSGYDGEGRSFAYDIFGNYRTTNDIGAIGIYSSGGDTLTPIITLQPTSEIFASVGDTIQIIVSGAVENGSVSYKWWKEDGSALSGDNYTGLTNDTLQIDSVTSAMHNLNIYCEVTNENAPLYSVNSNLVNILVSGESNAHVDTFYVTSGTDDGHYTSASRVYNSDIIMGKIGSGYVNGYYRFTGVTIPASLVDSAKMVFESAQNTSSSGVNYIIQAENTNNSQPVTDYSNITGRLTNLTTATDVHSSVESWTVDTKHELTVTNSVNELVGSYTFNNSPMSFFVLDNGSSTDTRRYAKGMHEVSTMLIVYWTN